MLAVRSPGAFDRPLRPLASLRSFDDRRLRGRARDSRKIASLAIAALPAVAAGCFTLANDMSARNGVVFERRCPLDIALIRDDRLILVFGGNGPPRYATLSVPESSRGELRAMLEELGAGDKAKIDGRVVENEWVFKYGRRSELAWTIRPVVATDAAGSGAERSIRFETGEVHFSERPPPLGAVDVFDLSRHDGSVLAAAYYNATTRRRILAPIAIVLDVLSSPIQLIWLAAQ